MLSSIEELLVLLRKFDDRIKPGEKFFVTGRRYHKDSSGKTLGVDETAEKAEVDRLKLFGIEVLRYEDHAVLSELLTLISRRDAVKPGLTPT